MNWKAILLLLGWAATAHGQINVPDEVPEHTLFTIGCECIVPANGEIKIDWKLSDGLSFAIPENTDGRKLYATGTPGDHWAESTVVTLTYQEIDVLIPDKENPEDITKAKWGKVKVAENFDISRYDRVFKILGEEPDPTPPGPEPPGPEPPGPQPPGPAPGLAGDLRKMLQALGPNYNRDKAAAIADNYLSIGSQGGDPARSGGWTLDTFRTKTKDLNYQVLTTEELAVWAVPLFQPLAEHMAKTYASRNLSPTNVPGIAKMWTEYGEAMKQAVY